MADLVMWHAIFQPNDVFGCIWAVGARLPGYFNYTGFWVTPVENDPDFEKYAVGGILGLRNAAFSNYRGFKTGPVLTYHFEGKVITTQMDASHYSFDDL